MLSLLHETTQLVDNSEHYASPCGQLKPTRAAPASGS